MNSTILYTQPYKVTLAVIFMLIGCALLITGFVIESMVYIFASTLPILLSSGMILVIYLTADEPDSFENGYHLYM